MGSIEDRFREEEARTQAIRDSALLKVYNKNVDLINELLPKIVEKIKSSPPGYYHWTDDKQFVSWGVSSRYLDNLYNEYKYIYACDILSDGRLINTRRQSLYKLKLIHGQEIILNRINSIDEDPLGDLFYPTTLFGALSYFYEDN